MRLGSTRLARSVDWQAFGQKGILSAGVIGAIGAIGLVDKKN
jgi:hypothetical protein